MGTGWGYFLLTDEEPEMNQLPIQGHTKGLNYRISKKEEVGQHVEDQFLMDPVESILNSSAICEGLDVLKGFRFERETTRGTWVA